MVNDFNLLICKGGRERLKELAGERLEKILTVRVESNVALFVVLETTMHKLLIRNITNLHHAYKDEYIQFVVSDCSCEDSDGQLKISENGEGLSYKLNTCYQSLGIVEDVKIVRDNVEWENENDTFQVAADVAIILDLEKGGQILFQAVDSLAGFIEIYEDEKMLDSIDEQWKMKTDMLKACNREIESI